MINKLAQAGIPADTLDLVLDFIDTLWTNLVGVLILTFLELVWTLFLKIFIDLAPVWGFALVLFGWSYMFYIKFVETSR